MQGLRFERDREGPGCEGIKNLPAGDVLCLWLPWAEVVNAVINTLINSAGVTCLNWEEKNPRDELEC